MIKIVHSLTKSDNEFDIIWVVDGKTFIVAYCLIILLTFGLVCEIMDHENGFEDTDDKENIFSLQYCGLKKSLPYRNCVIYSFLVSYSFKFRLFGDLKLNLKKRRL